ncbi:unnamed protein product [Darwinula stevensoni]|uniref:Uncharacterized protein n=1 Tax=Darwinula stevensoni TaxID=69355 RepID=A0A7R9A8B7_9CRUS|nr:unnamed protein product [Darwinula stevensoni]CAG0896244.1 unnamed protein product [Darwinula stevensoni]
MPNLFLLKSACMNKMWKVYKEKAIHSLEENKFHLASFPLIEMKWDDMDGEDQKDVEKMLESKICGIFGYAASGKSRKIEILIKRVLELGRRVLLFHCGGVLSRELCRHRWRAHSNVQVVSCSFETLQDIINHKDVKEAQAEVDEGVPLSVVVVEDCPMFLRTECDIEKVLRELHEKKLNLTLVFKPHSNDPQGISPDKEAFSHQSGGFHFSHPSHFRGREASTIISVNVCSEWMLEVISFARTRLIIIDFLQDHQDLWRAMLEGGHIETRDVSVEEDVSLRIARDSLLRADENWKFLMAPTWDVAAQRVGEEALEKGDIFDEGSGAIFYPPGSWDALNSISSNSPFRDWGYVFTDDAPGAVPQTEDQESDEVRDQLRQKGLEWNYQTDTPVPLKTSGRGGVLESLSLCLTGSLLHLSLLQLLFFLKEEESKWRTNGGESFSSLKNLMEPLYLSLLFLTSNVDQCGEATSSPWRGQGTLFPKENHLLRRAGCGVENSYPSTVENRMSAAIANGFTMQRILNNQNMPLLWDSNVALGIKIYPEKSQCFQYDSIHVF